MRRFLRAVAALTAVVLAWTSISMFSALRRLQDGDTAAGEALTAARSYAADMLSYDYRTMEQDFARARGHATGPLAEHYRTLAATLGPQARRLRIVQQAVVAAAGVESATPGEVRVLLFVNMVKTSTEPGQAVARQQVSEGRARFVLVTQGDGWRVSGLSSLLGDTPAR
ncbi:hypothetical protein [Microbispora sp. NPDC049125]|uniref:hypothetical protein n=1 Tax=Microbispora sp. NPDC049125 TaxID=3154929 RepID=UPI0034654341